MGSKGSKVSNVDDLQEIRGLARKLRRRFEEPPEAKEKDKEPQPKIENDDGLRQLLERQRHDHGCRERDAVKTKLSDIKTKMSDLTRQVREHTDTLQILTDLYGEDQPIEDVKSIVFDLKPTVFDQTLAECMTRALLLLKPGDHVWACLDTRDNPDTFVWNKLQDIDLVSDVKSITVNNRKKTFGRAAYPSSGLVVALFPGKLEYLGNTYQGKELIPLYNEWYGPNFTKKRDYTWIHSEKLAECVSTILCQCISRDVIQYIVVPYILEQPNWPLTFIFE
jgi:hypothetical protein